MSYHTAGYSKRTCAHMHTCAHTHTHTETLSRTRTRTGTHAHAHAHAHTHTHTHTHTQRHGERHSHARAHAQAHAHIKCNESIAEKTRNRNILRRTFQHSYKGPPVRPECHWRCIYKVVRRALVDTGSSDCELREAALGVYIPQGV